MFVWDQNPSLRKIQLSRSAILLCIRIFTQLFQRVVVGAHRQPTREIKVLVFVTQDFTARISIRDDNRPQSASKQAHRYHYTGPASEPNTAKSRYKKI